MTPLPLEKETILVRVNGVQGELAELKKFADFPFEEFAKGVGFKLAQYHLHRALEGVFHITAHILSRIPGGHEGGGYKEMARLLGDKGIVDREFANKKLANMAGYRNRLVHFYSEITPDELYKLLGNDLKDVEVFLKAVKTLLEKPEQHGLTIK
ncbi:MAG: DUF86 domain-containing protein [Deltaproteobacteria bacterium]|nr:DUF86 domain-containing protein [Deltaproteobacteria bacterium]